MKHILAFLLMSSASMMAVGQNEKALDILKKVNDQLSTNVSIEYDYTYKGWGKSYGNFSGKVYIDKSRGMNLGVLLKTYNDFGKLIQEEFIYTNGNDLKLLDKTNKVLKTGSASKGSGYLMSYAWYAVFREFLMPSPFQMNFNNKTLEYVGEKKVNGIDCHVVKLVNQWGETNNWYFGKNDYQIYGQKTENNNSGTEGGFLFEMSNSKINKPIDPNVFEVASEGVTTIDEDARIIAPGQKAPDWILKDINGSKVTSKELKGKKILLDFWASWCAPCWKIMPEIESIKSKFESTNLVVYGVNVWEKPNFKLKGYLKKKNIEQYKTLLDEDASVAKSFKIASLPLVVLIDENGKILYVNNGQDQNMVSNISNILNQ